MKKNILFRSSLLLALLALGCAKQVEEDFQTEGSVGAVRFVAQADYSYIWQQGKFTEGGAVTKTEYSGDYDKNDLTSTPVYERINWKTGDNVTLSLTTRTAGASAFATSATSASHYDITPGPVTPGTPGSKTHTATVAPSSGQERLKWQEGNYDYLFRGVYPAYTSSWVATVKAEGAKFKTNNWLVNNSGGDNYRNAWNTAVDNTASKNDEVAFVVPHTQAGTQENKTIDSKTVTVVSPDMKYAPMAAVSTVPKASAGSGNAVSLAFRPLFNAYEFRIAPVNDAASLSGKQLQRARLYVDDAHNVGLTGMWVEKVSGSHTAYHTARDPYSNGAVYASATAESNSNWQSLCSKEAVISFENLTFNNEVRFTFLSLPVEASGLVLELSFSDGIVRKLPLKTSGGQFITVRPGHKLLVSNLDVPGWKYFLSAPDQVNLEPTAGSGHLNGSSYYPFIKSYRKSLVNTNVWTPVDIETIEFLDKGNNVLSSAPAWLNGYYAKNANSQNWATSVTSFPAFTDGKLSNLDANGNPVIVYNVDSSGEHPTLTNYQSGTDSTFTFYFNWKAVDKQYGIMNEGEITKINGYDKAVPEFADMKDSDIIDLYAAPTVPGTTIGEYESANCYVVREPGWYAFPMVYGNALMGNNQSNTSAFNPGGSAAQADAPYLSRFINSKGNGISYGWIRPDISTGIPDNDWKPVILWQDAFQGYPIVEEEDVRIKMNWTYNARWILFRIKPYDSATSTGFRPGNVVIGLTYKEGGVTKLAWSWHIWITGDSLSPQDVAQHSGEVNQMMPVNLGWTPYFSYGTKPVYDKIRITQRYSKFTAVTTLNRVPDGQYYEGTLTSKMEGYSNTFYQWGRKDPFLPQSGREASGASWSSSERRMVGGIGAGTRVVMNTRENYYFDYKYPTPTDDSWPVLQREQGGTGYSICVPRLENIYLNVGQNVPQSMSESDYNGWLKEMILNPTKYFYDNCGKDVIYYYPEYVNLWNARQKDFNTSTPVVKTIYDPCPPGFCVPHYDAFTGFTTDGQPVAYSVSSSGYQKYGSSDYRGTEVSNHNSYNVKGRLIDGFYLPASGKRAYVSGAPQNHSKVGYYWTSTPNRNVNGSDSRKSVSARRFMFVINGQQNWLDETNIGFDNRTRMISIRPMVIPAGSGFGADNPGIDLDHWNGTGGFTW